MTHSIFITLYPKLREHDEKFFNYFRMSVTSFDELLEIIQEDLTPYKNYVVCSIFYNTSTRYGYARNTGRSTWHPSTSTRATLARKTRESRVALITSVLRASDETRDFIWTV
ncbi:unnamed protein product [Euphydryas editha]|uniref:Uncharacterized protein n=1 Tax=Euphydryas editha TaxID=104508 RepID=A0AAU9UQL9_EUPED|nr:unnamed protein product [Euphydryas editha]